ncbi:MAG: histidine triad nucleotide-binding protein [Pseudomonadota bacterium]
MTVSCIFCRIARGEIPANVVLDEPELFAFSDINPVAPTHVLVIPKRHIASLADITAVEAGIIGKMFLAAREIAALDGALTNGFRTVFNSGPDAGQTVSHLHLHVLAGRGMSWPPG